MQFMDLFKANRAGWGKEFGKAFTDLVSSHVSI